MLTRDLAPGGNQLRNQMMINQSSERVVFFGTTQMDERDRLRREANDEYLLGGAKAAQIGLRLARDFNDWCCADMIADYYDRIVKNPGLSGLVKNDRDSSDNFYLGDSSSTSGASQSQ